MASARDLIANYSTYTTARELNHSAGADSAGRTTPICLTGAYSAAVSVDATIDRTC